MQILIYCISASGPRRWLHSRWATHPAVAVLSIGKRWHRSSVHWRLLAEQCNWSSSDWTARQVPTGASPCHDWAAAHFTAATLRLQNSPFVNGIVFNSSGCEMAKIQKKNRSAADSVCDRSNLRDVIHNVRSECKMLNVSNAKCLGPVSQLTQNALHRPSDKQLQAVIQK